MYNNIVGRFQLKFYLRFWAMGLTPDNEQTTIAIPINMRHLEVTMEAEVSG